MLLELISNSNESKGIELKENTKEKQKENSHFAKLKKLLNCVYQ